MRPVACSCCRQQQHLQGGSRSSGRHVAADTAQRRHAAYNQDSPVENKLAMGHHKKH